MFNFRSPLLLVSFAIACNPPVDRNASQPGHDNNPTSHLFASETALVYAVNSGRMLLAYND